jgi:hypothetical protein
MEITSYKYRRVKRMVGIQGYTIARPAARAIYIDMLYSLVKWYIDNQLAYA